MPGDARSWDETAVLASGLLALVTMVPSLLRDNGTGSGLSKGSINGHLSVGTRPGNRRTGAEELGVQSTAVTDQSRGRGPGRWPRGLRLEVTGLEAQRSCQNPNMGSEAQDVRWVKEADENGRVGGVR